MSCSTGVPTSAPVMSVCTRIKARALSSAAARVRVDAHPAGTCSVALKSLAAVRRRTLVRMAEDAPTSDPASGRPKEDPDSEGSRSGNSAPDVPLWSTISAHPMVVAIVGGVIVLLIGAYVFGIGRSDGSSSPAATPGTDSTPDNVMEEVAARPFWASAPRLYDDAAGQRSSDDNNISEGSVSEGDVVAVTPRDLIERASRYAGKSVYLVGKVAAQEDLNTKHGLTTEYHLRGDEPGFDAYIAQDDERVVRAPNGGVVYALGRLAAAGESTHARGRTIKTVYFFCFNFCEFELVDGFLSQAESPAIRRAARGLRSAESVIQMADAP